MTVTEDDVCAFVVPGGDEAAHVRNATEHPAIAESIVGGALGPVGLADEDGLGRLLDLGKVAGVSDTVGIVVVVGDLRVDAIVEVCLLYTSPSPRDS